MQDKGEANYVLTCDGFVSEDTDEVGKLYWHSHIGIWLA